MNDLLPQFCTIQNRTVTDGKSKSESWAAQGTQTRCRVLKRTANTVNPEKTQHATVIRVRFVLPSGVTLAQRDRILHDSRIYEVIEVVKPYDASVQHHTVAICEAVA